MGRLTLLTSTINGCLLVSAAVGGLLFPDSYSVASSALPAGCIRLLDKQLLIRATCFLLPIMGLIGRDEDGQRIADIAHSLPPIPVQGLTLTLQIISYLLCFLATAIVGLRVFVRLRLSGPGWAWGWDDFFAVAGYVSETCSPPGGRERNKKGEGC